MGNSEKLKYLYGKKTQPVFSLYPTTSLHGLTTQKTITVGICFDFSIN